MRAVKSTFVKGLAIFNAPVLARILGINEFLPHLPNINKYLAATCMVIPSVCEWVVELLGDAEADSFHSERFDVFMANYPCGASSKSFEHLAQMVRTGRFMYFDYGEKRNLELYGQLETPSINLQKISKVPIGLIVGRNDLLSTVEDANWLRNTLQPEVLQMFRETNNGHAGFLMSKDMGFLEDIISFVRR